MFVSKIFKKSEESDNASGGPSLLCLFLPTVMPEHNPGDKQQLWPACEHHGQGVRLDIHMFLASISPGDAKLAAADRILGWIPQCSSTASLIVLVPHLAPPMLPTSTGQ